MEFVKRVVPQGIKNIYHYLQAFLAALFYGFPSRKLKVIGITGTDGKTTTVSLAYHILKSAGVKASMISSVKAVIGQASLDTGFHVTTPSPLELQKYLNMMVKAGSDVALLEVTSHGLDQGRVAFIDFFEGVVTNVTREHLDYHKTYKRYLEAKSKILNDVKFRILNADDPSFEELSKKGSGQMLSFGVRGDADFTAKNINQSEKYTNFDVKIKGREKQEKTLNIATPLYGEFNISNCLAAIAISKTFDVEDATIVSSLKEFPGVEGRMERIDEGQKFQVIIDFAHTPNSFEHTLKSLKKAAKNKLICVFGAAGERDKSKRAVMGNIAGRICNYSILTAEDPRHENVNDIIGEIAKGLEEAGGVLGSTYWKIPDRAKAIREAIISLASDGDTVVLLGKGHEKSLNLEGVEYPWSDQISARNALLEKLKK
ncbi:MAG: UDP-N-acetylmuramoyl-L-alanyl-D-glutamate--2,6-diaminopimelate ligase [Candidatus Woykebacteria bacterium]